jgi:hypothetical protein
VGDRIEFHDYLHSADFAILHGAITVLAERAAKAMVTNTTQEI